MAETKPIGITYDYENMTGTIRYFSKKPSFLNDEDSIIEDTFEINDETVLEAHEFLTQNVIEYAGHCAATDGKQEPGALDIEDDKEKE